MPDQDATSAGEPATAANEGRQGARFILAVAAAWGLVLLICISAVAVVAAWESLKLRVPVGVAVAARLAALAMILKAFWRCRVELICLVLLWLLQFVWLIPPHSQSQWMRSLSELCGIVGQIALPVVILGMAVRLTLSMMDRKLNVRQVAWRVGAVVVFILSGQMLLR